MATDPTSARHDAESRYDSSRHGCDDAPSNLGGRIASLRSFLHTVARRHCDRPEALNGVSDVVHDTFAKAYADQETFRGQSDRDLKAWLVGILRYNLLNYARSRRTRQAERNAVSLAPTNGDGTAPDVAAATLSPSGVVSLEEQRALMNRALQRLDARDRQVIIWHNHQGLRFEAIGRRLGGSADMARKAWYRAVSRLRDEFEALSRAS